jgi:hypothetical protein
VTFGRYPSDLPHGWLLSTRLQAGQNAEALAFYRPSATAMCTLPYLDLLDEVEGGCRAIRLGAEWKGAKSAQFSHPTPSPSRSSLRE